MVPHHSCSYADIAIDQIIDQNVMISINPWYDTISLWRRFIDVIICFWIGTEEENDSFDIWLNNLQKQLRFTKERSIIKSIYLDLKLIIKGIYIVSEMYSKPSDSHAYLLPSSCHPTHICRNIPIGIMKRVKRNCSDNESKEKCYNEYKQYLLNREYDEECIDKARDLAEETPREKLIGITDADHSENEEASVRKFPLS